MENVVRAKRMPKLPVVLSRTETSTLLRSMSGREALMAGLLYGSGPVSYTHLDVYKRQGQHHDQQQPESSGQKLYVPGVDRGSPKELLGTG